MNALDLLISFLLLLSISIGLVRGLLRELTSLIIGLSALFLGWWFYPELASFLAPWVPGKTIRQIVAFSAIALLSLGVGMRLGEGVRVLLVEKSGLRGTDRLLGGLFGTLRGLLLLSMLAFLGALTPWSNQLLWQESLLIGRLQVIAEQVFDRVPPRWKERLRAEGTPLHLPRP